MSANKHWARWSFASVSKHFDDTRQGYPLYIEGQHRDTDTLEDFFEFRMDGPTLRESSKGFWILRIDVNILASSTIDDEDYHKIHKLVGIAQAAFEDIPVYKYGDGPDDDQSLLGCYQLKQSRRKRDFVEAHQFGRIDISVPLIQAMVEGHFEMTLIT